MYLDLSKINTSKILSARKVFFIGIGGIGISALAKMCKARGMEVSGVNDEETGKTLDSLREEKIKVFFQKDLDKFPEADLYVYSDAWIYRGPKLIEQAKNSGKPTLSYFEALGEISKNYKTIAVSGTHGKTTTTAMVAEILIDAGLDPTVIIGSFMKKLAPSKGGVGSNFRKGESNPRQGGASYLVVEADEYNQHFLQFHPYIGAITNIEADHLDSYRDLEDIKQAFGQFLMQSENKISDYEKYLTKVPKLAVPGEHNRENAALALAIADVLGIEDKVAQDSLAKFSGTWRRLEKRAVSKEGTIIYDDYAHHPTEIRASISALKDLYPDKKLTIIFQPHLYSRTKALFTDFAKSFKGADTVMLLPIYFAREDKDESVSSDKLAEAIRKEGDKATSYLDFESAQKAVLALDLGSNDLFVTMGAGEAYRVADRVFGIDF